MILDTGTCLYLVLTDSHPTKLKYWNADPKAWNKADPKLSFSFFLSGRDIAGGVDRLRGQPAAGANPDQWKYPGQVYQATGAVHLNLWNFY